jgi:transposase InsO family protein
MGWVKQATVEAGGGGDAALTTTEREELAALRKEIKPLRQEREILKRALGFARRGSHAGIRPTFEARETLSAHHAGGQRARAVSRRVEPRVHEGDAAWGVVRRHHVHLDAAGLGLAVLIDLCTHSIVERAVSERCGAELALRCLNRAAAHHRPGAGLLHHTDRGSTYTASAYRSRLRELGMIQSMSRRGDCWDACSSRWSR